MNRKKALLLANILFLLAGVACTPSWTTAIRYGKTADHAFSETVKGEITNGLIIVPVKIANKSYRFLFDTGATLSISNEIQEEFGFKKVSTGGLVDSDNNRQKVNYVRVDTLKIGTIPFIHQTAFVADFTKHPVIACLNIDGIIGSNLMRHCQWTIDYQNAEIVLFKDTINEFPENTIHLPFAQSKQFDQIVSLKFKKATLKNLKIDYGSNGSLTISRNSMEVLKENDIVTKTFTEQGRTSSGLYGQSRASNREFAWADTLSNNELIIEGAEIKTGKSGLIGTEILSRFVVTLNFKQKQISFIPVENTTPDYSTFGFSINHTNNETFFVQAVRDQSPAQEAGLQPGFKVLKFNNLDFTNGSNFCDYVSYRSADDICKLVYVDDSGTTISKEIRKQFIYQ